MINTFIRVCQYNIESLNNKKPLLINFLTENDIDICLLNETWLKDTSKCRIPNYNLINQNGQNGRGGVAILVKSDFKYKILQLPFCDYLQTVAIVLQTSFGDFSVLCAYSPPRGRFKCAKLKQIINTLPKPMLLAGDLNAHHVAFGCRSTNSRGNDVYNILDECDLCILNSGSPTTVGTAYHNQSAIDISCISPSLASLCDWKVHSDPMGSYHYPTIIDIYTSVDKYEVNDPSERYLYNKADWSLFRSETKEAFKHFTIDENQPLSCYNNFIDILNKVKEVCIPKVTHVTQYTIRKPVPWWDDECAEAVRKSKVALNYYRSHPSVDNFLQYKKVDALKKKLLSEKKKSSWRTLCESFNRNTPVSRIWNYMRRFKRVSIQKHSKNDDWLPSFLDKFAPLSPPEKFIDHSDLDLYFRNNGNHKATFLSKAFTWEEFCLAIKSRRDTSPGLDDIPYKVINNLHDDAKYILLKIFNLLWDTNNLPPSWKTQCVIPILKPGKPDNDPHSYRPISLSSCIGKLFECMLKTRLDFYVETNSILPLEQFGFRRGRSATESFTSLICDIKNSFYSHSSTVCAFIDVQGAFDNVDPSVLAQILSEIGVPGKVCKWIFDFLYERTLFVKYNNKLHGPRTVYKGTMQGATISPLLYNIYTSQIKKYLKTPNVNFLQFADDLLIYSVNKNVNTAVNNLNSALVELHSYYQNKLKLSISPSKSGAMIFSKRHYNCDGDIMYNNNPLPWLSEKKFLGICLDSKLTFETHINYIIRNASLGLNILRSLAGVHWGSDPKTLSMLYKSIVRSHFDYSALAYMNANITLLRKLDLMQNKALRIITGAMCSTPIHNMECESCIPPLLFRRIQMAERFCLKLITSNNLCVLDHLLPPTYTLRNKEPYVDTGHILSGITPTLMRICVYIQSVFVNMYKNILWPMYDTDFETLIQPVNVKCDQVLTQTELLCYIEKQGDPYRLYTDGSKTPDSTTSAFYDPQLKFTKCTEIDKQCSIFTAECYAILQALQYVQNVTNDKILVISDSKSVLLALENTTLNCKANYLLIHIKKILNHLFKSGKVVNFLWVRSHCGITGNEVVDRATRQAPNEDHSNTLKVPGSDYYNLLSMALKTVYEEYWKTICKEKGVWYAKIQKTPPAQPWYNSIKYCDRKFVTTITRIRFGHCRIPSHLYKLKMTENPKCKECNHNPGDLNHIVFQCPKFNLNRLILVSNLDLVSEGVPLPHDLQTLLSEVKYFRPLYYFFKHSLENV